MRKPKTGDKYNLKSGVVEIVGWEVNKLGKVWIHYVRTTGIDGWMEETTFYEIYERTSK